MAQEIKYTHRTRDGRKARIVATDFQHDCYPVLAFVQRADGSENTQSYTATLRAASYVGGESNWDLFEYNPWNDVPIDTPVWVKQKSDSTWEPRHFAGVSRMGKPNVYPEGKSSHTCVDDTPNYWDVTTLENPNITKTKE